LQTSARPCARRPPYPSHKLEQQRRNGI